MKVADETDYDDYDEYIDHLAHWLAYNVELYGQGGLDPQGHFYKLIKEFNRSLNES